MFQQPPSTYPNATFVRDLFCCFPQSWLRSSNVEQAYAAPQVATSVPVQGQTTTVVEPAEATATTTTSAPQVGVPAGGPVMTAAPNAPVIHNMNATSIPTTMNAATTTAPAFQQQYVAAAPVMPGIGSSGVTSGVPTGAPVAAGGYRGGYTNVGGYGGGGLAGGFGGYNTTMARAPATQSQPSVLVIENGRRRHRSHSHGRHHHHHHHRSHSLGRHGWRRELRHMAEDAVDGVQLGHGRGGYGYGYDQAGGALPVGRQGHRGLTRTKSYESY